MNQPDRTPSASRDSAITPVTNPVAAHPITSAVIFVLVAGAICGTLIVPIYARVTPKIGDFPFFYFYLLAYMPVAAIAIWLASLLQRRLAPPASASDGGAGVTR